VFAFVVAGCSAMDPMKQGTFPVDHMILTELLQKHVNSNGLVDYRSMQNDSAELRRYLEELSNNPPNDENWSREEKLAYWINAYNAFTLDLILQHYPVSSIKDIGASLQVPFINSPWDMAFVRIDDEFITLNNIEHNILRKTFDEPRIHFAINCASISCPNLRRYAYTSDSIEFQLSQQAIDFINDPSKNILGAEVIRLSKIFQWFGSDFTKDQTKQEFINNWSKQPINSDADIDYMDYDWSLNDQNLMDKKRRD
jgi:hypothetical protein